ncbi:MAG: methylated-DNA--[protein]-cysteine S-methyltransferase [Gemmatimonadales bacterium]
METMHFAIGTSSLGLVLVATTEKGIRAVQIGDNAESLRRELAKRFPLATLRVADASTTALAEKVIGFIESPTRKIDLPLDIRGTAFQRMVWQALRGIPAGSTASYTDVARRIGKPTSARAVAHACATNAVAILIPCHRVLRSDGSLSGYCWGVERKRALLERERTQLRRSQLPTSPHDPAEAGAHASFA